MFFVRSIASCVAYFPPLTVMSPGDQGESAWQLETSRCTVICARYSFALDNIITKAEGLSN